MHCRSVAYSKGMNQSIRVSFPGMANRFTHGLCHEVFPRNGLNSNKSIQVFNLKLALQ
jgi:hypothetical protein